MSYKKPVIILQVLIGIGILVACLFFFEKSDREIVTLLPDPGETKKRPEDAGGIVIPNSDSLVYEKLQFGVKKDRKINILPSPEEPLELEESIDEDDSVISMDAIDEILSNIEYSDVYNNDDKTDNIDEYIVPPILQDKSEDDSNDNKIIVPGTNLNIIKSTEKRFDQSTKNVAENSRNAYKLQLSVALSQNDATLKWQNIIKTYGKILGEVRLITKKIVNNDNRIFYLVMAGTYPSLDQAKTACRKLHAHKQNCLIIK